RRGRSHIDRGHAPDVNILLTKFTKSPLFINGFAQVRTDACRYLNRASRHVLTPDSRRSVMFTSPKHYSSTKPVELFAVLALALSTLVAVVSIGIARAEGLTACSQIKPLT